jgi:hypothetical protein
MDSAALVAAICGAAVAYGVVKRQWWKASGSFAIGSAGLLNFVTAGNHSHLEHLVVFAMSNILIAYFLIVVVVVGRAQRRTG